MALAAAALELLLVNGTTYYVALGTAGDILGDTFTELTTAGYARKGHAAWTTAVVESTTLVRRNNGAVVFDALDAEATVTWWAIFDAAVAGKLLLCAPVLDGNGVPTPMDVEAGDQPRFNSGDLLIASIPEST